MTIIEALKSGQLLRRPEREWQSRSTSWLAFSLAPKDLKPLTWKHPEWLMEAVHLTKDDILANDWEIKEA